MSKVTIIRQAIISRKILDLRYHDVSRQVWPHILGYAGEGELTLSAWQVSGTGAGWRLFHVDDITDLDDTGRKFSQTAKGYNPNDPAFFRILERI